MSQDERYVTDSAEDAAERERLRCLEAALDPLADKLLVFAALILLLRNGVINGPGVIAVLTILLREVAISGLREALGPSGKTLPVTLLAKWKTTVQLIACGLLLASAPRGLIGEILTPFAVGALWLAAGLTLWTGFGYASRAVAMLSGKDPS